MATCDRDAKGEATSGDTTRPIVRIREDCDLRLNDLVFTAPPEESRPTIIFDDAAEARLSESTVHRKGRHAHP